MFASNAQDKVAFSITLVFDFVFVVFFSLVPGCDNFA